MRHLSEGVLRRLLDEPAAVADPDRRHIAGCPQCLGGLAAIRQDAVAVSAALSAESDVNVDVAWRRLSAASARPVTSSAGTASAARTASAGAGGPRDGGYGGVRRRPGSPVRRPLVSIRRPVVAAVVAALVLTGAGTAAANNWLQIFRTEQVAAVGLTTADLVALPDLSAYGDLALTSDPNVHEVADAATAAAESGLDVPEVGDLPRGVSGDAMYQVGGKAVATFTFSADRAELAAKEAGATLPAPPPGLDGSPVRLVAGPGVAQLWTSSAGAPALIVGRAVAPTAYSSGLPFEEIRDYLLSLPGLPPAIAAQLRTFTADGSTLPLPVPADQVTTSSAVVNGLPATVLTTRDQTLAAVVWVDDGVVTAVAGSLDTDEVLAVAQDLR
ncbi:MAG TPA: hypothetical protein VF642_04740 [Propionibacteriaceae bacterium]